MSDAARIMKALALVAVLAGAAHADTKSWSALKAHVPPGAIGIVSGDLAAAAKQPAFTKAFAAFATAQQEMGTVLAMAKQKCGFDPLQQLTDATLIIGQKNHGVVAFGVNGMDEAQLGKCLGALAASDKPGNTLTSRKVGPLTKYWENGKPEDKDPLYVAWLAKDVIAIGVDAGHPDDLTAVLKGGTLPADLSAMVGKLDTGATAWGAGIKLDKMEKVWGTLSLKGALTIDIHVTMGTAAQAKGLRDETIGAFAHASKNVPTVGKALKNVAIGGTGADVTIKGVVAEDQLVPLATDFDHAF